VFDFVVFGTSQLNSILNVWVLLQELLFLVQGLSSVPLLCKGLSKETPIAYPFLIIMMSCFVADA